MSTHKKGNNSLQKHFLILVLVFFALPASLPADAMELLHLSGKKNSLEGLHKSNMWTLVMVWSLDCIACEEQKPMIDRFHVDHHLSNAQVIGIASDGDKAINGIVELVRQTPVRFHSYVPRTNSFKDDYLAVTGKDFHGTPTYLLFKPGGELVGVHAGTLKREELEDIVGPAKQLQTPSADLIR